MIEGYTFSGVPYPSPAFARFTDALLDGHMGVLKGADIQVGNNQFVIDEGEFIIKGRHFRIVGSETVDITTQSSGTLYCKLIAEIDLTKESTASNFDQVNFKILTSAENYPSLTQQDINSGNPGNNLYQYEVARFKLNSGGVTDFQDMRTFLDFDSIYDQIRKHIQDIDNESIFQLKPTILFKDRIGVNVADGIPLNDNSENYDSIEILCGKNTQHLIGRSGLMCVKIYPKISKYASVSNYVKLNARESQLMSCRFFIDGNLLTQMDCQYINLNDNNSVDIGNENSMYIFQVIGYKM